MKLSSDISIINALLQYKTRCRVINRILKIFLQRSIQRTCMQTLNYYSADYRLHCYTRIHSDATEKHTPESLRLTVLSYTYIFQFGFRYRDAQPFHSSSTIIGIHATTCEYECQL